MVSPVCLTTRFNSRFPLFLSLKSHLLRQNLILHLDLQTLLLVMATSASLSSNSASHIHPSPTTNPSPNYIYHDSEYWIYLIKITTTNYLTWTALFTPIFRRCNLTDIIEASMKSIASFPTPHSCNGGIIYLLLFLSRGCNHST